MITFFSKDKEMVLTDGTHLIGCQIIILFWYIAKYQNWLGRHEKLFLPLAIFISYWNTNIWFSGIMFYLQTSDR